MKTISYVFGAAVLAAVVCSSVFAEKITVDPNKNGGSTTNLEVKESEPDLRLAQKITYTSTDKRLHTVLEELSKETGVDIQSGKNADDWPVRDIPLVVCVKDISLGKLMRAIADATHLALSASTVKDVKHYRIWRTPTRQAQLSDYFKSLEETKKAKLNAQWDAWAKLKEKGVVGIYEGDRPELDTTDILRSTADIMAALPAGSKEAVMSGKMLTFDIKSASPQLAQALRTYYQRLGVYAKAIYESTIEAMPADTEKRYRPKPPPEMTEALMQKLKFAVGKESSFYESMGKGMPQINSYNYDSYQSGLHLGLEENPLADGHEFSSPVKGSAAYMRMGADGSEQALEPPVTDFARNMRKLDAEYGDTKGLDKTFKIPKPKESGKQTFADVIVAIAKASGFSIVCEDFQSHRYNMSGSFSFHDKETTLKALLVPFSYDHSSSGSWSSGADWLVDPVGKIVVGLDMTWWAKHKSLAPEKVISGLINKMNGEGLEIDDVASTLLMPPDQYSEWVVGHKDLGNSLQSGVTGKNEVLWKMYAELSPENKALAKSKEGLPLASLNRNDVVAAFGEYASKAEKTGEFGKLMSVRNCMMTQPDMWARIEFWAIRKYPQLNENSDASAGSTPEMPPDIGEFLKSLVEAFPEAKAALEPPPTDPAKVLSLKMRLAKVDFGGSKAMMMSGGVPAGEGEKKPHKYSLTFEGDGIKVEAGSLGSIYPIYSEKRSRELIAEQKKKSEKTEPVKPK